jgi:hypothetical protein
MKTAFMFFFLCSVCCFLFAVDTALAFGDPIKSIQLVETLQENQTAVIKMPDGSLKKVAVGDDIFSKQDTANSIQGTADGKQKIGNSKQVAADGKQQTADGAGKKKSKFKKGATVQITPAKESARRIKGQRIVTVVEILDNKLVLEEMTPKGLDTIVLSLVDGGKGKVTKVTKISKYSGDTKPQMGMTPVSGSLVTDRKQ